MTTLDKLAFLDKKNINGYCIININGAYYINKTNTQEITTYLINLFNEAIKRSKQHNQDKMIINVFLDNYSTKNISSEYILTISKLLITLFSDKVEKCNIIKPSYIFKDILKNVKKFISPAIKNTIFYISND